MPDQKPDNTKGLLVLAGIVLALYFTSTKTPGPSPVEPKTDAASATASVFPSLKRTYADVCNEVADLIESKTLTNEEALLKWLAPKTGAAREASFKQFYLAMDKDIPTEFAGKEAEIAAWWRRVARSW